MIRLRSLGQNLIEVGETVVSPVAETLFATALYFALEGRRPAGRQEVAELLWPDAGEQRAQHNLRQTLYKLNAMGAALRSDRTRIVLPARSVDADAVRVLAAKEGPELEALAEEIRGPFLPGYAPTFSPAFADWLERKRDVVHSAMRRVFVGAITARRHRGEWAGAEALAVRCLAIDPLNEEATLAVAEAAAMLGSKVRALSILDRYLHDIGSGARELRVPATALRRRIAEVYDGDHLPVRRIPLIGREQEMAELMRALSLAGDGQGSALYVWGEPGMGKTRLTTEFARAAGLQRVQVARVGCQSHDERRPMSAFVDLVPKLLELPGAIGCTPDTMKYVKRLVQHDPAETALSPDSREAEQLFANIRKAFFDLLDAIAAEGRLIVVIEDVHWLDRMSWELLWDMVGWVGTRRIVVVVTSRRHLLTSHPSSQDAPTFSDQALRPLSNTASKRLVDALTANTPREGDPEFAAWCTKMGAGNPYYLSELALHTSIDRGEYTIPPTLSKLISQRLTTISDTATRVLQVCCILGKLSTVERLESLLNERRIVLLAAIEELDRHGAIESDGSRILCKHELLSAAVLRRLSPITKAIMHRHAAELLGQEASAIGSTSLQWECAEHWQAAGENDRAVTILRSCARHSLDIGLPDEAARVLETAGAYAREPDVRMAIAEDRVRALRLGSFWDKLLTAVDELRQLRRSVHDELELIHFQARWRTGEDMVVLLRAALSCISSDRASSAHRISAGTWALTLADNLCDQNAARRVFALATKVLEDPALSRDAVCHFNLVYHTAFGDTALASDAARELIAAATREGDDMVVRLRRLTHGTIALRWNGETDAAIAVARQAVQLAEAAGLPAQLVGPAGQLAAIYLASGDLARAEHWYLRAIDGCAALRDAPAESAIYSLGAEIAARLGRLTEATALIERSSKALGEATSPRSEARLTALRWYVRLLKKPRAVANSRDMQRALRLFERAKHTVGQDLFAHVLYTLLQNAGDASAASQLIADYLDNARRGRAPLLSEIVRNRDA